MRTALRNLLCVSFLAVSAAPGATSAAPTDLANARRADSLRHEAGRLAGQGNLDQALDLVEKRASELPAVWTAMFSGKLELDGEDAARGYAGASADSAPELMRGEATFRLGQYQYAAGRYHLAIPQFRAYLKEFPEGGWSQESAYWMALACVRLSQQRPDRGGYLDTALTYLRVLEAKGRAAYYWPLARAAEARIHLLQGDTVAAAKALRDARARAPAEERPGVFLLSLQAEPRSPEAGAWEDSLRWNYPLSPEAGMLAESEGSSTPPALRPRAATPPPPTPEVSIPVTVPVPVPIPVPSKPAPVEPVAQAAPSRPRGTHALQLGAFSLPENAERLRAELAAKNIAARVEPLRSGSGSGDRTLYRVLAGDYPDAATAQRDGKKLFVPLGYAYRVVETKSK